MRGIFLVGTILFSLLLSFTMPAQAQKKGQSATVQYGKVVQKESVNLNSGWCLVVLLSAALWGWQVLAVRATRKRRATL